MTVERYAEWLAHGRAHQVEGRAIDAMLCFRRALREAPNGIDAQFHLGEIAWQLGQRAEAIAQWRAVGERAPEHAASMHALAESLAATGQFDASAEVARRLLERTPGNPRAVALFTLLQAGRPDVTDASLAQAIRFGRGWPLALLAHVAKGLYSQPGKGVVSDAGNALQEAAFASMVTEDGKDSLRVIAMSLAGAGLRAASEAFAACYAQSCRTLHGPAMPLAWPLRTAGERLRVGLLAGSDPDTGMESRIAELVSAVSAKDVEWKLFSFARSGAAAAPPIAGLAPHTLPAIMETAVRAIVAFDLDVLIDFAGLREPSGPLLALRPARRLWAVEAEDVPAVPLLTDRVFRGNARQSTAELVAALEHHRAGIADSPYPPIPASAEELSARWDAAVRAHQDGDPAAAQSVYAWMLERQPGYAPAHFLTGVIARDQGRIDDARAAFEAAVAAAPAFADARAALAGLLLQLGDAASAGRLAKEGLAIAAESAALWRALGRAELELGDADAALAAFAEALKRDPADGETHYNQGVALQMQRNLADAARAYQRALAFRPDMHSADFNLGVVFEQQGNVNAAISAFTKVLERAPRHVRAYKALSEALLASGRVDAWVANFERFERAVPDHIAVAALALEVCPSRGEFQKLGHYLDDLRRERFSASDPDDLIDALQQILYLLLFVDVEPELVGRYAHLHDAAMRRASATPLPRRESRNPGKLRIGYLSGDFRNHVMGKMMWAALRHHDREHFDLFGYTTTDAHDEWTPRIVDLFDRVESVAALSDRDAAQRIAEDDLDVLVDLSTHTKGARPGILALKPACVQVTHVASAGTAAMSAIDFKLTDRHADAGPDATNQIEAPLVMDGCVYPYRHVEPAPVETFRRETQGIAQDAIVIGAFCAPLKLSQRCLALWREVLMRIPRALLAFSPVNPALHNTYLRIVTAGDIDPARVIFIPQGRDDAENQARYRLIDFVLDPMPYGGVNGTIEALDMGVPVVTLVGRRHGERTSYSILSNLGVTDTVAQTGPEYVDLAVRLAADATFAADVRARIERALGHSVLTDMPAHTRSLERAYVAALERCTVDRER